MKYLLIMIIIISGCFKPMTNDQIIAEIVKCRKAGLGVIQLRDGWSSCIVRIECTPCSLEVSK